MDLEFDPLPEPLSDLDDDRLPLWDWLSDRLPDLLEDSDPLREVLPEREPDKERLADLLSLPDSLELRPRLDEPDREREFEDDSDADALFDEDLLVPEDADSLRLAEPERLRESLLLADEDPDPDSLSDPLSRSASPRDSVAERVSKLISAPEFCAISVSAAFRDRI